MTVETNKIHRLYPVEQAHKARVLYESWSARLIAYAFVFILTLSYALISDLLLGMSTKTVTLGCVAIAAFLMILSPVVYDRIRQKKDEEIQIRLENEEILRLEKELKAILTDLNKFDEVTKAIVFRKLIEVIFDEINRNEKDWTTTLSEFIKGKYERIGQKS